ncbi:MAG: type II toxin-antitoxin system PemK/MazF family toxin [Bacteroidota bacterium]|nr:type II toxin-antitoxin system PemK/MazF family toxin [Bacteroidota bacterium]MDQ6889685.1 type II toxin-antitoxin system PemK/MazF family toxin [Bacteroidota bacterium]
MKQGEIWYADLEPVKGSEQSGKRPVVIISGAAMNISLQIVIVCPLTGVIKNIKGCIVVNKNEINNLKKNSEVLVLQVRTISKIRLSKKIGEITKNEIELIKQGINLYLNF